MDKFYKKLSDDNEDIIKRAVRKAMLNYRNPNQKMNPGDIFQGEGGENFKKMLNGKADKDIVQKLQELKVNKIDLNNMLDV